MKIHIFLFWTFVLGEGESFVVEAMLTLVSDGGHVLRITNGCSEYIHVLNNFSRERSNIHCVSKSVDIMSILHVLQS